MITQNQPYSRTNFRQTFDYSLTSVYNARALESTGDRNFMESNNPNLGDDVRVEELAPEPEHTTAEAQDTPITFCTDGQFSSA